MQSPLNNLLLKSLLFLIINTSSETDYYAVILAIGSEENSVAFYLKSETDSFCFRLSIWNSITKNIQIIMLLQWQKHNYKDYLCEAELSYHILLQRKQRHLKG